MAGLLCAITLHVALPTRSLSLTPLPLRNYATAQRCARASPHIMMAGNGKREAIDGSGAIDVAAQEVIDNIVQEELADLAKQTPEEQENKLPSLLARVEARAIDEVGALASDDGSNEGSRRGYQFGDITKAVVESTRGEVQRQMDAEWDMNDISLLLKVGLFLGAGAAAPAAGLAALPAAALIATYGTVLKAELGVRAVQEVGTRITERAAQGIADGVKTYTGKEDCECFRIRTRAPCRSLLTSGCSNLNYRR